MAEIPEFYFDFDAIKGLSYEDGFKALFLQLQHHYNSHINKKPTFVFGVDPAQPGEDRTVVSKTEPNQPPQPPQEPPARVKPDNETITPKTVSMKSFKILPGEKVEGYNNGMVLVGTADDGSGVMDKLLPGYDEAPFGPVVSGVNGRYNLKGESK